MSIVLPTTIVLDIKLDETDISTLIQPQQYSIITINIVELFAKTIKNRFSDKLEKFIQL